MCDTLQLQNFLQSQAQEARRRMQRRDKWVLDLSLHINMTSEMTIYLVLLYMIHQYIR